MESHYEEPSRKRKLRENSSLQEHDPAKDEQLLIIKTSKFHNSTVSLFDVKRATCESEYSRSSSHENLDLELNLLPWDSGMKRQKPHESSHIFIDLNQNQNHLNNDNNNKKKNASELGLTRRRASSPVADNRKEAASVDAAEEEEEMVAMVCTKCHMLVMLWKSSPACPNCKFVHSYEQSSQKPFKPFSLLC